MAARRMTFGLFKETYEDFIKELRKNFNVTLYRRPSEDYGFAQAYECGFIIEPEEGAGWKDYFRNYLIHKALRFWPEGEIWNVRIKPDQDRENRLVCTFSIVFNNYQEDVYRDSNFQ